MATRSKLKRGLIEIAAAVVLIAISVVVFGWATLGWWEPNNGSGPDQPDISSLILYTNDPAARISANLLIDAGADGEVSVQLRLEIGGPQDPAAFRWAVVGRGDMAFQPRSMSGTSEEPIPAKELSQHCGEPGRSAGRVESALIGNLAGGYQIGSKGESVLPEWDPTRAAGASYMLNIELPNQHVERRGEHYSVSVGPIGAPDTEWDQQIADFNVSYFPKCINLDAATAAIDAGDLQAWSGGWDVRVETESVGDKLDLAEPTPLRADLASWKTDGFQVLTATYTDEGLRQLRQTALFLAGIAVGVGTGFLVQGITNVTTRPNGD